MKRSLENIAGLGGGGGYRRISPRYYTRLPPFGLYFSLNKGIHTNISSPRRYSLPHKRRNDNYLERGKAYYQRQNGELSMK